MTLQKKFFGLALLLLSTDAAVTVATAATYVAPDYGTSSSGCAGIGAVPVTEAECADASASVLGAGLTPGYTWMGSIEKGGWPDGCVFTNAGKAYWNSNPADGSDKNLGVICKQDGSVTATATTTTTLDPTAPTYVLPGWNTASSDCAGIGAVPVLEEECQAAGEIMLQFLPPLYYVGSYDAGSSFPHGCIYSAAGYNHWNTNPADNAYWEFGTICKYDGPPPTTTTTTTPAEYMTGGYAPSHTDERAGINSAETITAPFALTGIPYEDELIDKRGNPDSPYKDEFGNYTKDAADGGACNGKGFLCDFTNSTFGAQQEYTPQMVVWKIVDPQDVLYNTDMYTWQTLNCEVKINTEDSNADQSNHWFYVPTGQENIQDRKGNYCDIEAVYREINDTALSMLDTITVRGESNRLNSTGNAEQLIGEQFDLTCTCETKLETEAATTFDQMYLALIHSMKGTAQERTMSVKLELYSDGGLTDQVAPGGTFPATEPSFFFLARHVYDNDWDVKLQLTTCIACPDSTGCSVLDGPGNTAVMFYETCDVKTGGPQLRGIDGDSWMQPGGFTNWSNADPTNSPYHVLGFQKFRLSSSNSMQVTCMVTGCEAGPNDCPPCGTRARAFFGDSRRLQSFGTSELAIGINFPSSGSNQDETMAEDGTMAGQSNGSDSAAPVSFGLIAMAGVAAAACAYVTRSFVKNRSAAAGRSVS